MESVHANQHGRGRRCEDDLLGNQRSSLFMTFSGSYRYQGKETARVCNPGCRQVLLRRLDGSNQLLDTVFNRLIRVEVVG